MNRFPNNLSDEDLARVVGMMGAVALLIGAFVLLSTGVPSPQVLVAATQLGILQGVPPSVSYAGPAGIRPSREEILSMQYPDLPTCYLNIGKYSLGIVGSTYAPSSVQSTWCLNVPDNPNTLSDYYENPDLKQWWGSDFYSGIFSLNAAATPTIGKTAYIKSSFFPHNEESLYLGSAGCSWYYDETGGQYCVSYGGDTVTPGSCASYTLPEGYDSTEIRSEGSGSDAQPVGVCYAVKHIPSSLQSQVLEEGSTPKVASGGDLTLQWQCMPERTVDWWMRYWKGNWYGGGYYSDTGGTVYSISPLGTETVGSGPGFTAGGFLVDTKTIKAPTAEGTYTYTLACNGTGSYTIQPVGYSGGPTYGLFNNNGWYSPPPVSGKLPVLSIDVEVTDQPIQLPPTASFSGDSTGVVGRPVHIAASFVTRNDDESIVDSAINGCGEPNKTGSQCDVSVGASGPPDSLEYTFTPPKKGTYTFYAALKTSLFNNWDDYAVKTITVSDPTQCIGSFDHANICVGAEDTIQSTLTTSCNADVKCDWTCEFGYTKQGNECVLVQCTGEHEENPPTCTCVSGYEKNNNGQCVLEKPTLRIETVPSGRARAGSSVTVNWEADNVAADGSETCSVTSVPQSEFSETFDPSLLSGSDWVGTGNFTIGSQTTLNLSCRATETGASLGSVSATVGLIPVSKEI